MPNALSTERSLYLRQHAGNPVAWMPWGDAVFERARREGKLVFVSIGYAACHWCHVMERESFDDDEVASILNTKFIPVKVDRQERPDIDAVYMSICQAATGHGGWPLTVVLTPDKQVVFVGTYFPKRSTPYRIGLLELLERIASLWEQQRQDVVAAASALMERAAPLFRVAEPGRVDRATCELAAIQLAQSYDERFGGFGQQPKFPMASTLWFLLVWGSVGGDSTTLSMVTRTLDAMRWSGLWDHVGLGFHRYCTDQQWFLPHFEKMLYDQALLLMLYAEAAACTGNVLYRRTAFEIADYMERCLLLGCGAFAAAEDADTADGEGAYYQWRYDELATIVSSEDLARMCALFGVTERGNAHDEASGEPTGRNILYAGTSTERVAKQFGSSLDDYWEWWEPVRCRLLEHRLVRPRPLRDEQILCDWNALAIVGLARAGRLLGERSFIERAERCWRYLEHAHRLPDGGLAHCSYDGECSGYGFLDDHAFVAWGLLELYQATSSDSYLEAACHVTDIIATHFTTTDGLLLNTTGQDVPAFTEPFDGATVSAVGITAYVEATLGMLCSNPERSKRAERLLERYGSTVNKHPTASCTMMVAYLMLTAGETLSIELPDRDWYRLSELLTRQHSPLRLIAATTYTDPSRNAPHAILCTPDACSAPLTEWTAIEHALRASKA
ncbi:MAG: hypothetical protein KatS3mg039_0925 [Candidatus Kapaibacterium sp.]|nr:MAG: hypothetical protein KatS3mg039_0925 [Candidatus Kapabacteria bacterium]